MSREIKLGRWFYCKYCYRNIRPQISEDAGLVVCPLCDYGLAPLEAVRAAGSLQAWWEKLVAEFNAKYGRTAKL